MGVIVGENDDSGDSGKVEWVGLIMDMEQLLKKLKEHEDPDYKKFHANLGVNVELIGVRTPVLHQLAKEIAGTNAVEFLDSYQKTCYETDVIYGLVLGYAKLPYKERVPYLYRLADLIDNWATCDLTSSRQRWIRKSQADFLEELECLWNTEQPWKQRLVYVLLLDFYLEEQYLELVYSFCERPFQKEYYVQMAVAWLLSMALVKYPEQTERYLRGCSLDDFTFNKALQKARESRQIEGEKKQLYQKMKR